MGESNTSLRAWRTTFVLVLVILGGYAGLELGNQFISTASNPKYAFTNVFTSTYHEILTNGGNAANLAGTITVIVLFTLLGALISYLISTTAFNRLVRIGDQVRSMPTSEKVAAVAGV